MSVLAISAMEPDLRKAEGNLADALKYGDISAVQAALDKGANPNKFNALVGYRGQSPIAFVWQNAPYNKKYELIELLIAKGADRSELDYLLAKPVAQADVEQVRWFLEHGAQDKDGTLLALAKERREEFRDAGDDEEANKFSEVIALLERKSVASKLIPKAKPKPATRPTNTTPVKRIPRKPASAQPE